MPYGGMDAAATWETLLIRHTSVFHALALSGSVSLPAAFLFAIMTTGLAGGLIKPYKGIRPAALTRSESPPTASLFTGSR